MPLFLINFAAGGGDSMWSFALPNGKQLICPLAAQGSPSRPIIPQSTPKPLLLSGHLHSSGLEPIWYLLTPTLTIEVTNCPHWRVSFAPMLHILIAAHITRPCNRSEQSSFGFDAVAMSFPQVDISYLVPAARKQSYAMLQRNSIPFTTNRFLFHAFTITGGCTMDQPHWPACLYLVRRFVANHLSRAMTFIVSRKRVHRKKNPVQ